MELETIKIILQLTQENARHVAILNGEMGGVLAELGIIKWFIGINVIAWVGIIVGAIWKKLIRNGN